MYEVIAIAAGVVLGPVAQNITATQLKIATLILSSVIVGTIVSFISGELLEN